MVAGVAPAPALGMFWLGTIYVLSGACALIYEVIWVRLLKLILGNTVYAASVVVSVFLGGLALGAYLMGRRAGRFKNPVRTYAVIEILVAVAAALIPLILKACDAVYVGFFLHVSQSPAMLTVLQVLLCGVILLVPTILMGSTLPLLSRHVMAAGGAMGRHVGRLYALNTFGAALGTFLAGFVLLRTMGVWGAIAFAVVVNVLVALAAMRLAILVPDRSEEPAAPQGGAAASGSNGDGWWRAGGIVLVGAFISGFVSIGYELAWMRSVIFLLGADTYVFAAVLTAYLVGNMLGAWVASRISHRLRSNAAGFGVTLALLGISGLLYVPSLIGWTKTFMRWIDPLSQGFATTGLIPVSVLIPLAHATALFLVPSFLMGLGFPMALEAFFAHRRDAAGTASRIYSVNTLGAVASGLITAFLLLPWLGVQGCVALLGTAGLAFGAVMIWMFAAGQRFRLIAPALLAATGILSFVWVPRDLFRREFIRYSTTDLVDVVEGVTTTVSVHREKNGDKWLCTSGIQVAGDQLQCVQRMLGHLGILLHPDAQDVLTVGFGTGETTYCLSKHNPARLDCVEISPELAAMSLKHFSHRNLGQRLGDRVNMTFMDAKNYLHLTSNKYDLIMTDSISPKAFADNASLYTKEYFESARSHLKPGGMVVCWTPFNMPPSCFKSVLGTFVESFPYSSVWYPVMWKDHFVLLVGTEGPQVFAPARIASKMAANPMVRESVNGIRLFDAEDVLACYIGDGADIRGAIGTYGMNSDYRPFVEFSPDPFLEEKPKWQLFLAFAEAARKNGIMKYLDLGGMTEDARKRYAADLRTRFISDTLMIRTDMAADTNVDPAEITRIKADLTNYLERHVKYTGGYLVRGALSAALGQNREAVDDMGRVLETDPDNGFALNIRGEAYMRMGENEKALADLEKAVEKHPSFPLARFNLAMLQAKLGRRAEAMMHLDRVVQMEPANPSGYAKRATAFAAQGDNEKALEDFNMAVKLGNALPWILAERGKFLAGCGKYEQALDDLTRAVVQDPTGAEWLDYRGCIYFSLGKFDQAVADFSAAIRLDPRRTSVYVNRGLALAEKKDFDRSLADYSKAAELDTENPLIFYNKGVAMFRKGDYAKAVEDFGTAIKLNPHAGAAFAARASCYARMGQFDLAAKDIAVSDSLKAAVDEQLRKLVAEQAGGSADRRKP